MTPKAGSWCTLGQGIALTQVTASKCHCKSAIPIPNLSSGNGSWPDQAATEQSVEDLLLLMTNNKIVIFMHRASYPLLSN